MTRGGGVLASALLLLAVAASARAQVAPTPAELAGYTGAFAAAARDDAAAIAALAARGPLGTLRDTRGRTPLHVAAFGGRHAAMRALVSAGVDPNALEGDRYDIVTIAAVGDDQPTLELALALGGSPRNVTSRYDGTALIAAAHLGHAGVVRALIRAGAPLDHINNLGWTALIESIVLGDGGARHTDTLRALVEAGADVRLADREGRTPLALARARGYGAMVALLEQAEARRPAAGGGQGGGACGEVETIPTHGSTTTRYALAAPSGAAPPEGRTALVLLAGGGGHLDLDDRGCPRALVGNSLVRSIPVFVAAGFVTALIDSPSDYVGEDGLAAFRNAPEHAQDLGKVIADVRKRAGGPVWLLGTSRGTISASNAASRLTGPAAPDGVVLTSALMVGQRGRKAFVSQTVFDLQLEAIKVPVLIVGHAADTCPRSPATQMERVAARVGSARKQVVTVTGGPGAARGAGTLAACEGRAPHGFVEQEEAVAAGITRFVRGERY
jgi:hypothetical protein